MEKLMHQSWWKILGILLVLYALTAGMLVPLKSNLSTVTPDSADLGGPVTLTMSGYNTSFAPGEVTAFLRYGDGYALRASEVTVDGPQTARATFQLPPSLPESRAKNARLSLIVSSTADGTFVSPDALFVRQPPGSAVIVNPRPWQESQLADGGLAPATRTTFPYRGLLAETIRNTYFHVSLWFAMMFLFIAAVTYAIKRLRIQDQPEAYRLRTRADTLSYCFTAVGMLFGVLGLLTGAVWAQYTWGKFWSWDIKQFTTLIALLIYGGYFVLRAAFPDPEQRGRLSAVYNVFAFACLIPLIYILPRISGNSLHPGAAGNPALGGEDLDNTMRMVFYPTIIGWTLIGGWLATLSYRARRLVMN